ncbi:MAG: alpha/beta fold hydrolase [Myxococcota bacterium]|jgi:polyhydroxyalkanoate synthase|nr:alpha/beta fold hydrolase [Myxococcota bacterium]
MLGAMSIFTGALLLSSIGRSESVHIPTEDGSWVALTHHPAAGAPVILVHGISCNHRFWDLTPETSWVTSLNEAGLDVWLLDLRGHGDAEKGPEGEHLSQGWSVDDYGRNDLPAAIDHVRSVTGAERVGYVGHSMGGMVLAIYQAWHGDEALSAAVILASPVDFARPDPMWVLSSRGSQLAQVLPWIPTPLFARWFSLLGDHVPFSMDELFFATDNTALSTRQLALETIVSPMFRHEIQQFGEFLGEGHFTAVDGSVDYLAALESLTTPLLVVAGRADALAPVDRVQPWVNRTSSPARRMVIAGRANGFGADYGHLDLVLGDQVSEEIHPLVIGWLDRWNTAPPDP